MKYVQNANDIYHVSTDYGVETKFHMTASELKSDEFTTADITDTRPTSLNKNVITTFNIRANCEHIVNHVK